MSGSQNPAQELFRLNRALTLAHDQRARRVGEADAFGGEAFDQRQVDCLLRIHVDDKVGDGDVVDDFEGQGGVVEGFEVGAVEAGLGLGGNGRYK